MDHQTFVDIIPSFDFLAFIQDNIPVRNIFLAFLFIFKLNQSSDM